MGAMIGDSDTSLNWVRYRYQAWEKGFGNVASVTHPDNDDRETRPSMDGQTKPSLLYSDQELLWAIAEAENLEELREAIEENRKHIEKTKEWTEGGLNND